MSDDRLNAACPGCDRTDKLGIDGHDFGEIGSGAYAVKCQHCGWRGPETYRIEDVWTRWNRRAYLDRSSSNEAVAVKALEWKESWSGSSEDIPTWRGTDGLGWMVMVDFAHLRIAKHSEADPEALAAKMAAEQSRYETRIRSALEPSPAQPPDLTAKAWEIIGEHMSPGQMVADPEALALDIAATFEAIKHGSTLAASKITPAAQHPQPASAR